MSLRGRLSSAAAAWDRFWFAPVDASTLALVRIGFGLVAFLWGLSLIPSLGAIFGERGILPHAPSGRPGAWTLLAPLHSDLGLVLMLVVLLIAAACLTVGYRTRLAAVLVFVAITSFDRRNPFVFNSGDDLIRILALCLALAPTGATLSLDAWRRERAHFWSAPLVRAWSLRLMQVQLSVLYAASVWAKLRGFAWNDGTAVSYALRIKDIQRFAAPDVLTHSVTASELMSYGTIAVEASLALLVWNRRARPWVLALGVLVHFSTEVTLRLGLFAWTLLVLYLAFLPPETARGLIERARVRLVRPRAGALAASES